MDIMSLLQQSGFNPGAGAPGGGSMPTGTGMGAINQSGGLLQLLAGLGGGGGAQPPPAPSGTAGGGVSGSYTPPPGMSAPEGMGPGTQIKSLDEIKGMVGGGLGGTAPGPSAMQKGFGAGVGALGKTMGGSSTQPAMAAPKMAPISQFQPPQYTPPGQVGMNKTAMSPFYKG